MSGDPTFSQPPIGDPALDAPVSPAQRRTFRALRYRNYRLFFFGQMISVIGTWMQITALQLLVVRLYPSPDDAARWLGAVNFIPLIPLVPFALIGGSLADRFPRRTLVIVAQSILMATAFLMYVFTESGLVTIWHIIALSIVQGIGSAIDIPARQTLIVEMVEGNPDDMSSAIALNSSIFNLGRAIGPAIAGVIVAAVGEADAFLFNGLSFVAVLIGLLLMRLPTRPADERPQKMRKHLIDGFRYISSHNTILILLSLIAATAFLAMSFYTLLPLFAKFTLADSAAPITEFVCSRVECATPEALTLGLLNALFGFGALAGALIVAAWADVRGRGRMLTIGNIGFPVVLLLFALSRSVWLSLGLLFLIGIGWVMQASLTNTLLQLTTPNQVRGRVMSVYSMMFQGMWRVGGMAMGFVAAVASPPIAVGLGAALALSYGAFTATRWPQIRRLN